MGGQRIDDIERRLWVLNDGGLYLLWRKDGRAIKAWIKDNRNIIDELIRNVLEAKKKPHYFVYG